MKNLLASLVSVAGLEPVELTLGPTKPDNGAADNLSPIKGDHAFYTYFVPGAVFQAKDGSTWIIENLPAEGAGYCRIRNVWYPREEATVLQQWIRDAIDMWIYPVIQVVPVLPEKK
jgi:hypothetical protein